MKRSRWKRFWVALDQLLNVVLCDGWEDETMSSNVYRMELEGKPAGKWRARIDWLFSPWQTEHCYRAWRAELNRSQLPPSLRGD